MHPCLCIDEILTRIISHFIPPWPQVHSEWELQTLTAMGLACKTFYEPAMAASWERLVGLRRLMRTFPDGVVAFNVGYGYTYVDQRRPAVKSGPSAWVVVREPYAWEWYRFSSYAKRVRYLDLHGDFDVQRYNIDVFADYMKTHFGNTPMLPELRLLITELQYLKRPKLLTLFLQPKLLDFIMDAGAQLPPAVLSDVLATTTVCAPSIRHVSCRLLSVEQLRSLSPLRHLHSLHCRLQAKNMYDVLQHQPQNISGPVLPTLKVLNLCLGSPLFIAAMGIKWFASAAPGLAELDVHCTDMAVEPYTLVLFMAAVATFGGRLASCKITIEPKIVWPDDMLIPAGVALAPLHRLGGTLHALDLGEVVLKLGEADVTALARACPNLTRLALGHRRDRTSSCVPVTALERIADCCPALQYLALPLDEFCVAPPPPVIEHEALVDLHTGCKLYLVHSHVFIRQLFPAAEVWY